MLHAITGILQSTHGTAALTLALFALILFGIEIIVSERYYAKNKEATRQPANHDYGALFIRIFPFVALATIIFGANLIVAVLIGAIVATIGTFVLYKHRTKPVTVKQKV